MRKRSFGLSTVDIEFIPPLTLPQGLPPPIDLTAVADYRAQRQNGTDEDNPERPFPNDGTYGWVSDEDIAVYLKLPPRPGVFRCKYTQGPLDKAWMEERDRNYLARRASEEAQQQQGAGAGASAVASDGSGAAGVSTDDSAAASPSP